MEEMAGRAESHNKNRRTYTAEVLRTRMNKTVVVAVTRSFIHPLYKKVLRRANRLKAHDAQGTCRVGDQVRIQESRPLSKDKHWRVIEIINRTRVSGGN